MNTVYLYIVFSFCIKLCLNDEISEVFKRIFDRFAIKYSFDIEEILSSMEQWKIKKLRLRRTYKVRQNSLAFKFAKNKILDYFLTFK